MNYIVTKEQIQDLFSKGEITLDGVLSIVSRPQQPPEVQVVNVVNETKETPEIPDRQRFRGRNSESQRAVYLAKKADPWARPIDIAIDLGMPESTVQGLFRDR